MNTSDRPEVTPETGAFRTVRGVFYRAVDPAFAEHALSGSRSVGRYSPPGFPALYLSASAEGVAAAMVAHRDGRSEQLSVLAFEVEAARIVDLRDHTELVPLGIDPAEAAADWQADAAAGRTPPPWRVRETLQARGAQGLIDPSRRRPGLWHLTLFAWNTPGAARVRPHTGAAPRN